MWLTSLRSQFVTAIVVAGSLAAPTVARDWTPGPSLNIARSQLAAVVDENGTIYAIGGKTSWCPPNSGTDSVEFLSPGASSWQFGPSLSQPRMDCSALCVGGFIYVVGGWNADGYVATVDRFDTLSLSPHWEQISAELNIARAIPGVTSDSLGRIYVIGGKSSASVYERTVEMYDPMRPTDGWVLLTSQLGTPRLKCGAVTASDGNIYVFGGEGPAGEHLRSVEKFDPLHPELGWSYVADISGPNSNDDMGPIGADGCVYLIGGWLPGFSNRVVRYRPETGQSWQWAPLSEPKANVSSVLGPNGHVYAIGGTSYGCPDPVTTVEILDTNPCLADTTGDGILDFFDVQTFLNAFSAGCP